MAKPYNRPEDTKKSRQSSDKQVIPADSVTLLSINTPFVLHSFLLTIQADPELRRAFFPIHIGLPARPRWKLARQVYIEVYSTRENDLEGTVLERAANIGLLKLGVDAGNDNYIAKPTSRWTANVEIPGVKEIEVARQAMLDTSKRSQHFLCPLSQVGFQEQWKGWADVPPCYRPMLRFYYPYYFTLRNLCAPYPISHPSQSSPISTPPVTPFQPSDNSSPIQPYIDRILIMNATYSPPSLFATHLSASQRSIKRKMRSDRSSGKADVEGEIRHGLSYELTRRSEDMSLQDVPESNIPQNREEGDRGQGTGSVVAMNEDGIGSKEKAKRIQKRIIDISERESLIGTDLPISPPPSPQLPFGFLSSGSSTAVRSQPSSHLSESISSRHPTGMPNGRPRWRVSSRSPTPERRSYAVKVGRGEDVAGEKRIKAVVYNSPHAPAALPSARPEEYQCPPTYTPPLSARRTPSLPLASSGHLPPTHGICHAVTDLATSSSGLVGDEDPFQTPPSLPELNPVPTPSQSPQLVAAQPASPRKRKRPSWVTCTPPKPRPKSNSLPRSPSPSPALSPEIDIKIEPDELMPIKEQVEDMARREAARLAQRQTKLTGKRRGSGCSQRGDRTKRKSWAWSSR
ncbi:hypothetical protein L198_07924 [Cryptococcus wingfieldii CBS 7118]|uniref:Uncharacterized protein n=1 Tax=Cryptococcus wingfieldii CBS 7118 TaxID=1295528 RepID=A0A1E3HS52_9TREE|nr:hypothetical protein L198_07924 [Cryptococcus wingfieldii CBS 7118]ODN79174.1 hypothetical protein L198_07924 [Cryptococcus wingfieldii CBS 7118]